MSPQRLAQVRSIFDQTVELPVEERAAAIARACGGDEELRREVETLLAARDASRSFMNTPAGALSALSRVAAFGADSEAMVGRSLGQYRILSLLGRGGMGEVYLAQQERPRRTVAIKLIRAGLMSESILRRFEHEAQILGRLKHPGIAQVFEAGAARDQSGRSHSFIAMEYVEGPTLVEYARRHALTSRTRLELFTLVCDAVEHAHQKGVIHRDLKPANILVENREEGSTASSTTGAPDPGSSSITASTRVVRMPFQPKVMDFGVARVTGVDAAVTTMQTDAGQMIGTLQYMSPEQIRGASHEVDTRSDVFALGVILFELLADRPPLELRGKGVVEAGREVLETVPVRLGSLVRGLRGDVETIVSKAIEKDPRRRYQSAAALGADLRRFLAGEPVAARPSTAAYHLQKLVQRHKAISALLALLVVSSFAFGVGMAALYRKAERGRADAEAAKLEANAQAERATSEAATARAVAAFMRDVFNRARPAKEGDAGTSAVDMLDAAVKQMEQKPPSSPEVAAELYTSIAFAYEGLGKYEKAYAFERRAEPIVETLRGGRSTQLAQVCADLADLARKLGRYDEAREYIRRYTSIQAEIFGGEDAHAVSGIESGALLAWEVGELDSAEVLFRGVLSRVRSGLSKEPSFAARVLNNYAGLLSDRHRYAEAEGMVRESISLWEQDHGFLAPTRRANALNNLAWLLYRQGKHEESETTAREALRIQTAIYGVDNPNVASVETTLGATLAAQQRFDEALPLLRHSLRVRAGALARSSDVTAETRRLLAGVLASKGELASAKDLLVEGIGALDDGLRSRSAKRELLVALIEIHTKLGESDAAEARNAELRELSVDSAGP